MIYIGADHRGFALKEVIKTFLKDKKIEFEDVGNLVYNPEDDYPDWALAVARAVAKDIGHSAKGIVICGSGVGVDIVANKVKGIRCGLGFDGKQVKMARENDDINCLALAADFIDEEKAENLIEIFLETPFSGEEKHKRRVEKIRSYETA